MSRAAPATRHANHSDISGRHALFGQMEHTPALEVVLGLQLLLPDAGEHAPFLWPVGQSNLIPGLQALQSPRNKPAALSHGAHTYRDMLPVTMLFQVRCCGAAIPRS